jgi:regulator of RNase E activity RraA
MVIEPGDLVIGDDDGILCVPFDHAETIYEAARKKHEAEEKKMLAIGEGRDDRSWIDASLARLGCAIEV